MLEILKDSGIQESWINAVKDYTKLKAIFDGPYQSYCNIRELLSEEKWAYYATMGVTGLREQKLLDAARKNLRRAWADSFSKKKDNKDQGPGTKEPESSGGSVK